MKLALVTAYPPSKVTLNEYAFHLVRQLRQKQSVTELVLLTDVQPDQVHTCFEEQGCQVRVVPCWSFNSLSNILTINKAISAEKPDAILYNLQFMKFGDSKIAAALGLLTPMVTRLRRIPSIVLLHNIMETVDLDSAGFTANRLFQAIFSLIGNMLTRIILKANKVAVTMDKYVDILERKYRATNVMHIPHGTFETAEEPSYAVDQSKPLQVMTFGKFGTYKKVEDMIEAVEMIRARTNLNLEIVIAGTDNPNVPGYLESVKQKYADVKQIRFTGYVEEEEVPTLFNEAAVVVFPYTSTTGSSGVLHQAGSYGKAVVMPDLGDLALLMEDEGYAGELFDPSSAEDLSHAIERIVANHQHRVALSKANYQAATRYPMTRIADMYLAAFDQVMNTQKAGVSSSSSWSTELA
ncbi:MAG: glycosyltransferase [Saprospiraceae bacterium]|nr:glycosyltransferase [Saprospiraceae bacterium]